MLEKPKNATEKSKQEDNEEPDSEASCDEFGICFLFLFYCHEKTTLNIHDSFYGSQTKDGDE